jgi:hypothetical protein
MVMWCNPWSWTFFTNDSFAWEIQQNGEAGTLPYYSVAHKEFISDIRERAAVQLDDIVSQILGSGARAMTRATK